MNRGPDCRCGHMISVHNPTGKGNRGRCNYRYGAFSDPPTLGEQCDCRRYNSATEARI